ncbi:MAG TPA: hypothetical protein VFU07_07210 [Candidatus Lumbricidophila sp.]|nr:hypothetical protein [Candidatus Lumbricidophila sp.]
MSVELLRSKMVKARKAHRCRTCASVAVAVGDTYSRDTYVYDGRVYDWVQCRECVALSGAVFNWCSYVDEGIGAEQYEEWATEHADHDERAQAFLARWGANQ